MNPKVIKVSPLENYKLLLTFDNEEAKVFDVSPFLDKGMYRELKDKSLFNTVKISGLSIEWINGQDFSPEDLYEYSENVSKDNIKSIQSIPPSLRSTSL